MSASVLHLISALTPGGAGRTGLETAAIGAEAGQRSQLASVEPAHPGMARMAATRDVELLDAPPVEELLAAIATADLVQLHHWNSPALLEFLEHELPEMRLIVWPHVNGLTSPQVLPADLMSAADTTLASSELNRRAITSLLRDSGKAEPDIAVIPSIGGWEGLGSIESRRRERGVTIGYVGTVGFAKLIPEFSEVCARIDAPAARFLVCGTGDASRVLRDQMAELGLGERFELRGHVPQVGPALAEMDVFGFPLRAEGSGSSDLVLKEAMFAGVPPVVLANCGCDELVDDGRTGLVAQDLDGYVAAVERLARDPDERHRLGVAAGETARRLWDPEVVAPTWKRIWEAALSAPKRSRPPVLPEVSGPHLGPERMLRGFGAEGELFRTSLYGTEPEALAADRDIAQLTTPIGLGEGGIFHHGRLYPDDPMLALWSGLFLGRHGHPALGAGLLSKARALGIPSARVDPHLEALAA